MVTIISTKNLNTMGVDVILRTFSTKMPKTGIFPMTYLQLRMSCSERPVEASPLQVLSSITWQSIPRSNVTMRRFSTNHLNESSVKLHLIQQIPLSSADPSRPWRKCTNVWKSIYLSIYLSTWSMVIQIFWSANIEIMSCWILCKTTRFFIIMATKSWEVIFRDQNPPANVASGKPGANSRAKLWMFQWHPIK